MALKKVLFVLNHKAGKNNTIDLHECFVGNGEKHSYTCAVYKLGEKPFEEIKQEIASFKPEIVAAAGGDGTINLLATILQNTDIKLLMIPTGSANGMAKEFNMPLNVEECLALINTGKTMAIDLLKINDKISVHLADVGLNARIVKRFQLDRKRGMFTYAKYLFNEVFFIKKRSFLIETEKETRKVKAVSLTFANATQYGTGAVINPDGKLNDGIFEICIVKPFPKIHLASIAIKMFRNRLKYSEFFETIHCKKAFVSSKKPTLLQIDGEIEGKVREIKLECLPKVLQVIVPNNLNYPTLVSQFP